MKRKQTLLAFAGSLTLSAACLSTNALALDVTCLLYTSPSPRDLSTSRMPSSA